MLRQHLQQNKNQRLRQRRPFFQRSKQNSKFRSSIELLSSLITPIFRPQLTFREKGEQPQFLNNFL